MCEYCEGEKPLIGDFSDGALIENGKNPKIRIGTGRPEWGAEPGKQYFVITWEA